MMSYKQYQVACGGGERANQDGSEIPLSSHGEKVQASLVEVTGKVLEARQGWNGGL